MAGWWQQLEANAEAVNCADVSEAHQAMPLPHWGPPAARAGSVYELAIRFQAGAADEPGD